MRQAVISTIFTLLTVLWLSLSATALSEEDRKDMSKLITSLLGTEAPVQLKKVKVWPGKDSVRVALYPEKEVHFKYQKLPGKQEDRIYIDLLNTTGSPSLLSGIPTSPFLKAVRMGQRDTGVRVVLDTGKIEKYNVTVMSEPYRIVIDYYGKRAPSSPKNNAVSTQKKTDKKRHEHKQKPGKKRPFVLVIDPGHGGKDPGASRAGVREKDIVLRLAKIVARKARKLPGMKVVLTRNKDIFLPLEERAALANAHDGDLFVSLHANVFRSADVHGIEVYHLDNQRDSYTEKLALVENKLTHTQSLLNTILVDMTMSFYVKDSLLYAASIGKHLKKQLKPYGTSIRGYKKGALFYVLVGARMPSLLIEIGFLSNTKERTCLQQDKYLNDLADAILSGIEQTRHSSRLSKASL